MKLALRSARPRLTGDFATPARAELALAIEALKAHDDGFSRLEKEREQSASTVYRCIAAEEEAKKVLEGASRACAEHAVAELVGEESEAPLTPQEARQKWEAETAALEGARATRELIREKLSLLSDRRHSLEWRVKECAQAVLQESPGIADFVAKFDDLEDRFLRALGDFIWLSSGNAFATFDGSNGIPIRDDRSKALNMRSRVLASRYFDWARHPHLAGESAAKWEAAFEALKRDANASLPEAIP